jgi:hypothetical protein
MPDPETGFSNECRHIPANEEKLARRMGSLLVQRGGTVYSAFTWYTSFSISPTVTLISQGRARFYMELVIKGLVNKNRPESPHDVLSA